MSSNAHRGGRGCHLTLTVPCHGTFHLFSLFLGCFKVSWYVILLHFIGNARVNCTQKYSHLLAHILIFQQREKLLHLNSDVSNSVVWSLLERVKGLPPTTLLETS